MQARHHEGLLVALRQLAQIGQTPVAMDRARIVAYATEHGQLPALRAVIPPHLAWPELTTI